jgi:hypothetical protein
MLVCGGLRILVYSGEYTIILHGGSYNCITIKIVTDIIHHYHIEQLVT